jgi:4-aminobutyrate aminotransferase-like enzyme
VFLISTTHGAETTGLAAMIATMDAFKQHGMIDSNWQRGIGLQEGLRQIIARHDLGNALELTGYPCLFALVCRDARGQPDDAFRTLMMQEMIARGVLFQGLFYPTWSHQQPELDHMARAFDESCSVYRRAIDLGTCEGLLVGPAAKPVFRKKI